MAKVLVVDDDKSLTTMLKDLLTFDHHSVEVAHDGDDASDKLTVSKYDLLVLDWDLPKSSGVDICRRLRGKGDLTPILMLTGKDHINDKTTGFEAGVDDYLTKPFHPKEFTARIGALLRRAAGQPSTNLVIRNISVDTLKFRVTKDGTDVELLPKEFAVLEFMMRHPDQVFSCEALLQRVWSSDSHTGPEAVRSCITRIRKKLEADGDPPLIKTVHGVGYKIVK